MRGVSITSLAPLVLINGAVLLVLCHGPVVGQHTGGRPQTTPDVLKPARGAAPHSLSAVLTPPVLEMDDKGQITRSDVWCSACEAAGRYADGARVPAKPMRFGDQRLDNVLNWFRSRKETMPVVLATQHVRFLLRVTPRKSRLSAEADKWLKRLLPKMKQRSTAHGRAHALVMAMHAGEGRMAYALGLGSQDPIKFDARKDYGKPSAVLDPPRGHYGSRSPMELVVIDDHKTYKAFGRHFLGAFGMETLHWYNKKSDSNLGLIDAAAIDHPALRGRMTHMLSHVFTASYRRYFNHLPAWFFAGHALCFEQFQESDSVTHCIGKGANRLPSRRVPPRSWRKWLHARVRSGKMTPIVKLIMKQDVGELTLHERIESWGLVQFLMVCDRKCFRIFMDTLKTQKESETLLELQYRAIRSAYGVDLITWEKAWHAWL